jgi:hypothetical protein
MTAAGWILMLSSVGFVLTLTVYCFYRVLTAPERDASNGSDREGGT